MWALIKCECLRFRQWALGMAALHLLLLGNLYIGGALRASDVAIAFSGAILYALLGLIFGLLQVGSYRSASQWAYLVHRPLPPACIWLSLVSAAALLILGVIVAPLYLVILGMDLGSALTMDLRFYLLPLYLYGLVFACYLCGTFILLSSSRAALFVLALPALFMTRDAGLWIFLPQLAAVGLLLWLNRCAFKPDRQAHPASLAALLPTALAIQWGLYCALHVASSLGYEMGLMAIKHHPNYNPAPNTRAGFRSMPSAAAMQYAFADSAGPMLKRELGLAEIHRIGPRIGPAWNHLPFAQQLPFADRGNILIDRERSIEWHFSHDQMLFKGINSRSGADSGWMGSSGTIYPSAAGIPAAEYFGEIPLIVDDTSLVTRHALYSADFDNRHLALRHALQGDEEYRSLLREGKTAAVLSDRKLYFFDAYEARNGRGLLQPEVVVPLPRGLDNLNWIYVAELADGFALTFFYGTHLREGWDPALLVSGLLPLGGDFNLVTSRELDPVYPTWFTYQQYLISPLFAYVGKATWSAIEPHGEGSVSPQRLLSRPLPGGVRGGMLLTALLCALATALLSRRIPLSRRGRASWILCNALTGLPGLLSFLFLTDRCQAGDPALRAKVAGEAQPA